MPCVTPAEQLQWARYLLDHGSAATAGVWPRASALLARHALEELLEEFWSLTAPSMVATRNVRAQLIALRGYAPVSASASPTSAGYAGVCRGCPHHPYELPCTRPALDWLSPAVRRVAATAGGGAGAARAPLIALRGYAPVSASASPISAAYAGLCRGCHHHPYELPPTRAELDWLIATVERFAATVGDATAASAAPPKPPAKRR